MHLAWDLLYGALIFLMSVWIASTIFVHFRGKKRLKFQRQLTDHSTIMAPYNALVYLFSGVKNTPILKLEDFPDLQPLKANWTAIRDEAMKLYEEGHIATSEKHNDLAFNSFFRRGWRRFYLKWYGDFMPSAKEICPQTVALVDSIPGIHAALFALLPGNSKLGEHRDPFAGSLRYHLGLMTPNSDQCRIYVDGEPYSWRDGEAVVFDETYIHSVNNDTDKPRLILFCDVARPISNPIFRAINDFVVHHIVKVTQAQNKDTEKVGVLNKFSSILYSFNSLGKGLKKRNKTAYKLVNAILTYGAVAAVIALVVWIGMRKH